MQTAISERLTVLVEEGQGSLSPVEHDRWSRRVSAFLQAAMGADQAADFNNLASPDSWEQHALRLGHLEGLMARAELKRVALTQLKHQHRIQSAFPCPHQIPVRYSLSTVMTMKRRRVLLVFWNGLVLSQSFCMSKQVQGVQSLKSLRSTLETSRSQ